MMNTRQARVIDPIVTAVARGYRPQGAMLAALLFPTVTVGERGGKIISFGADDFRLVNTQRAPGTHVKRVTFGYASGDYALVDHSLEAVVPTELQGEALAVPGINLITMGVRKVQNLMDLERENQAATLARNAATYGANVLNAGANQRWTDPDSDPFSQINDAKETIRARIGVRPNALGCSPKALSALKIHPKVLDRLSTSTDRSPATLEQLRRLFELEFIQEGEAIVNTAAVGATDPLFADVWGTDAILAYVTPASLQDMGSPSYGYTYQLEGHPFVEPGYAERPTKSYIYPVTDARKPVLVGANAGYLFQNVGAPAI